MPIQQKDFILRLIEELGAALRELRSRLARGGAPAAPAVVEEAISAQEELLGPLGPVVRAVDAATAASLINDTRTLRLWAELLRVEGEGRAASGEPELGAELARRADELARAAADREE